MKKWTTLSLTCLAVLSLAACANQKETKSEPGTVAEVSTSQTTTTETTSASTTETTETTQATTQASTEAETSETTQAQVSTGMNLDEIAAGDFSSIAGTWQNAMGISLTFDENGLVGHDLQMDTSRLSEGVIDFNVTTPNTIGGFAMTLIPAGVAAPAAADGGSDASDGTVDRILSGQQYYISNPDWFLYKVD